VVNILEQKHGDSWDRKDISSSYIPSLYFYIFLLVASTKYVFFFLVVKHKPNCQKINFGFSTFLNEIYLYSLGMY
jgi:hypothetical protein